MGDLVYAVVAGLLQGLLEWLPVSSSGQAMLFYMNLAGLEPGEAYRLSFALHAGTSAAAALYYRGFLASALSRPLGPEARLLAVPLAVGAPLALIVYNAFEGAEWPGDAANVAVAAGLAATAAALWATGRLARRGGRGLRELGLGDLVVLGVAQGVAAAPGLSRSALTILALMARGVDHRAAVDASFIAAVPAGLAAAVYSLASSPSPPGLAAGVALASSLAAGLVGVWAVRGLAARLGPGAFAAALVALAALLTLPALA